MEYKLKYIDENNIEKLKELNINFVSYKQQLEIDKLVETVFSAEKKWNRMNEIRVEVSAHKHEILESERKIKMLDLACEEIRLELKDLKEDVYADRRERLQNQLSANVSKMADCKTDITERQAKISAVESEFKELEQFILDFEETDFFTRRVNMLKDILSKNGYTADKRLMSDEFWQEMIDPSVITDLLLRIRYKDQAEKKNLNRM